MAILSKFFVETLGLKINRASCYEMIHTWNPSCYGAIADAWWDGLFFAFKTYLAFYTVTSIFSVKDIRQVHWRKIIIDAFRSTFFLTTNLVVFLWLMCRMRRMLGFFTVPTLGLINGILSSMLAIFIESQKRRPTLALYLTNLASETAYRQLVNHGYLKNIPSGVAIVFGMGIAGLLHLLRNNKLGAGSKKSIEYILLMDENKELLSHHAVYRMYSPIGNALLMLRYACGKHPLCQHNYSCLSRIVEAFCKNFFQGLIWSVCLSFLNSGTSAICQPLAFTRRLLVFRTLRLPLFYGSLASLFQVARCGSRWLMNRDSPPSSLCGALSGLAVLFYPNSSVAMYVFWKFIEAFYIGYCKRFAVPYGDVLLYGLSTGYVAWNATIEPQTLREGYWKFLVGLTGKRIELLNRRLFDPFGYCSSGKFPNFSPALDPNFVTFNESWSFIKKD